jgi:predicted transcriptional regulator
MQEALIRIAERDDRSFSATIRQALVAYLKTPA